MLSNLSTLQYCTLPYKVIKIIIFVLIAASAPKSTIDDLFGEADDSEDSDDIFSKKSSSNIFTAEREPVRSEIANKQKHLDVENVQNTSTMATSTPETNDKGKGLFEDEDDDLFGAAAKQAKPSDTSSTSSTKKVNVNLCKN